MIQRIYEWKISGWRQWTDVSDISWSGVFSHNCAHFSKYFSKSIQIIFVQCVQLKYFLTAVHTFQRIFSLKCIFSKPCSVHGIQKHFAAAFLFWLMNVSFCQEEIVFEWLFFPAQQLASDILDNLITPFRPMGPWVWWCGHSIAVGDDTLFHLQTSLIPRIDVWIVWCKCKYVLVKVLHSSTIVNALVQTRGPWGNGYSCMTLSPHTSNMIVTIMM